MATSSPAVELSGITWNHTRGFLPVVATAQRFAELNPHISIQWQKRSLQQFADAPLAQLTARFDLLVIDHPSIGEAAEHGLLLPLDGHLPAEYLADQAANSVGQSHASYNYDGHQYALAIDAATPVAGWRADLLNESEIPRTWDELLALARRGLVTVPAIPIDSLMNLFMLANALGAEPFTKPERGHRSRAGKGSPATPPRTSPPLRARFARAQPHPHLAAPRDLRHRRLLPLRLRILQLLASGLRRQPHHRGSARKPPRHAPLRSTLGGAGLAISASCKSIPEAITYAAYTANGQTQSTLYAYSGGQPGHRAAWLHPALNAFTQNFFTNTLSTLDSAWVRPRFPGFIDFQDHASNIVHAYLVDGGPESKVLAHLNQALQEHQA